MSGASDDLAPGIHHRISEAAYHADQAPVPSLSSSIADLLVHRSPRHAWAQHPKLNTMRESNDDTPAMEEGRLLHALLLGQPVEVAEGDFDDWRTKEARALRAEARERGAVPVLSWRMAEIERCVDAFSQQLAEHEECAAALTEGQPEATLIWREEMTWCRSRVDWLPHNPWGHLVDIKSTSGSADPDTWERKLREDYALQAAFYLRGARACGLHPAGMVFLVIETAPPHGLCAFQPTADLLGVAEQKVCEALDLWETCLRTGVWPGYPRRICHVEAPGWMLARAEERSLMAPQRLRAVKPTRQQIEVHNENLRLIGEMGRAVP